MAEREAALGTRLLSRTTRKLSVTDAGQTALQSLVLQHVFQAAFDFSGASDSRSRLQEVPARRTPPQWYAALVERAPTANGSGQPTPARLLATHQKPESNKDQCACEQSQNDIRK